MKIVAVKPGLSRLYVERMAWNLNTQKRHLKHQDLPPDDCVGWEVNYHRTGGYSNYYGVLLSHNEREQIHRVIEGLLRAVENEPNRWHRLALNTESGYQTSEGWVPDGQLRFHHKRATLLAFCKDKGVLPEFEKDKDGYYVLPFNLPEGAMTDYDPNKPDWDGSDTPVEEKPVLEVTEIATGTEIVVLDDWGLPVQTTEVI